jgi:hypothetical protein
MNVNLFFSRNDSARRSVGRGCVKIALLSHPFIIRLRIALFFLSAEAAINKAGPAAAADRCVQFTKRHPKRITRVGGGAGAGKAVIKSQIAHLSSRLFAAAPRNFHVTKVVLPGAAAPFLSPSQPSVEEETHKKEGASALCCC